jgi:hypothetical protein
VAAVHTDDHPSDRPPQPPPPGPPRSPSAGRPGVRWAWRVGGGLVAVVVLGFGLLQAVAQLAHEEETVVRHLDGAGLRQLDVHNSAGSVHVVGTSGDEVTVRARVSHGLRATQQSVDVDGDRLELRGSCPILGSNFCGVTYTVEVPERMAVRIRADNRISVSDVTGDVDASTDNGRIEAARIDGDVALHSDNGRVIGTDLRAGTAHGESDNGRVELAFLAAPHTVTARSDNGRVEVVLPDTPDDYVVDVQSDNGTAATPDIRTDPDAERTVTASSDNGDVTVRYAAH